jgi:hypothetical protein
MTGRDVIQIIRDNVRTVQETGVGSVPIETLQRLLNHLDSGEVDKDIALLIAAEKERATAKYGARVNSQLELFKSVIGSGQAALKSFFLLNGGAAVAVLALIGHLSTSATTAGQVNKYALPLVSFACGLVFTSMAAGGTYLVQKAYAEKRKRWANRFNTLVVWLCFGSLVAFCVGCYFAYVAIHGIAASASGIVDVDHNIM